MLVHNKVVILLLAALLAVHAGPVYFQQGLLGFLQPTQRPSRNAYPQQQQQRKGRSRYDQICKVHNPNPFAFPGKAPFPAQPLCSYG